MKRIGLLLLLVVLASGSVWGEVVEIPDLNHHSTEQDSITSADTGYHTYNGPYTGAGHLTQYQTQ